MSASEEGEENPAGGSAAGESEGPDDASPDNINPASSTIAGQQRTPSALHNRLLNQQRSNILLQVLFHHMLNSRRRREEEEALALSPPPLPDREMAVLEEAATTNGAVCRFCFEGSASSDNPLVAPCNCAGGSRWVHLDCLRQWQRLQARNVSSSEGGGGTTTYTAAGYICNVCNSPYLSRPPAVRSVRRNLLKRGTLLVSKPNVGRTFQNTVVLLLSDVGGSPQGAFGLIVNSPLQEELTPTSTNLLSSQDGNNSHNEEENSSQQNNNNNNNSAANHPVIEWRRGGPVCGGRLGVVHYTVLHTYPPCVAGSLDDVLDVDIDEEYFDEHEDAAATTTTTSSSNIVEIDLEAAMSDNDDEEASAVQGEVDDVEDLEDDIDENDEEDENDEGEVDSCAPLSLPVFDVQRNTPPLQFVASPHSSIPSTFSEDSLGHTVQRLVRNASADNTQEQAAETDDNDDNDNLQQQTNKVIVFSGYCKWRTGQLEREIQREVWDVCIDATPADILRHHDSGFWEEISESNRLLSWQRLIEEGEAGGSTEE